MQRGELRVKGVDDARATGEVLRAHGWSDDLCIVTQKGFAEDDKVAIRSVGGADPLLRTIAPSIRAADWPLAIVIDADEPGFRWQQLTDRFKRVGIVLPIEPAAEGFVGDFQNGQVQIKVGLWMMPDNRSSGGLEDFLQALVDEADPTYSHAVRCTGQLVEAGRNLFLESRRSKAELRAYLAWQAEPGCAYEVAVRRKYFKPELSAGKAFAEWFARVFGGPTSTRDDQPLTS